MRAGRFGADDEETVAKEESGTTAGSDSVDVELRRLNGDSGCCGFKDVLIASLTIARNVCTCTTLDTLLALAEKFGAGALYHVKTNDWRLCVLIIRCNGIADNTSGRTRQDSLETSEVVHVDETTVALHKFAASTFRPFLMLDTTCAQTSFKAGLETVNVLSDGWCEVGIRAHRSGSRYQLDHGHKLMAERDVAKANFFGDFADESLVVGEGVAVHETYSYAADTLVIDLL